MLTLQNSHILGDKDAQYCLIQPIDQNDEKLLTQEFNTICELCKGKTIMLIAFLVDNWMQDLTPWKAPAVFGKTNFGDGANQTLNYICDDLVPYLKTNVLTKPKETNLIIGGYSLAAVFALWAVTQTNLFDACATASPSVWFPNWTTYASTSLFNVDIIYLSLGDTENKSRNQHLARVNNHMEALVKMLKDKNYIFEWNEGNHFVQSDVRTAKAFSWCINQLANKQPLI